MKKILLGLFIFIVIYGDVMYEMETKSTGIMGLGDNVITIRNFIKSDRMRTEMKPQSSGINNGTFSAIIRLDKDVAWLLNPENKEYVEIPLEESVEKNSDSSVIPEFNIEKLEGTKEILNIKCEKYFVSIKINSEDEKIEITQTMWMGREFPGYYEIKGLSSKIQERMGEKGLIGIDNKLFRDLQKRISEIDGFPLEMEMHVKLESDDTKIELKSTSAIKKITTVPISDKVFEIPEGYIPAKNQDTN